MIKMTRAEYQAKYGAQPSVQPTPAPTTSTSQPIKMTRQQYAQKYGASSKIEPPKEFLPYATGLIKNIPGSGVKFAKDIWSGVTSLPGTIKQVASGDVKLGDIVKSVGKDIQTRYLNPGAARRTLYYDPVGVVSDVSTVIGGAGAAAKGAGIGAKALGATRTASKLADIGETAAKVSRAIDPLEIATKGLGKVGSTTVGKLQTKALQESDRALLSGLGNAGARQTKIEAKAGRSIPSFIREYGLELRDPAAAKQVVKDIGEQFDTAAKQASKTIPTGQIVKSFDDEIARLSQGAGGVVSENTQMMIEELEKRKQMFLKSQMKSERGIVKERVETPQPNIVREVPEETLKQYDVDLIDAETKQLLRNMYSDNEIGLFNRVKSMARAKDVAAGDIETIYRKNPDLMERALQAVKEKESNILTNDDAYNYILSLPTKAESVSPRVPKPEIIRQAPRVSFVDRNVEYLSTPLRTSVGDVTEFRRRVIDPDVPRSEFGLSPKETGRAGGVKASRDILRAETIKAVPELQKLGLDYGMAKEVAKIMQDSASRMSNRQRLNVFKLGSAGIGMWVKGIPGLIGGFALEQFVNSPQFSAVASNILRSAGEAKAPKGSSLFKKASKGTYLFGKTGRFINPDKND